MYAAGTRGGKLHVLLMTLGVVLAACSGSGDIRDSAGTVVTAGSWSVFDLRVGDCIAPDEFASGDADEVQLVPCVEPHESQVFGVVTYPDVAYPGTAALASFADETCLSLLTNDSGQLRDGQVYSYLLPTENGWVESDDRLIVCVQNVTSR